LYNKRTKMSEAGMIDTELGHWKDFIEAMLRK